MRDIALLVVDMQNALVSAKPYAAEEVIRNIKTLIKTCRENNAEVIFVQHNGEIGDELEPNSDGWQVWHRRKHGEYNKKINKAIKNFLMAF